MTGDAGRLAREIEFHRKIAARAEAVWNWDSPAGRRRAARRAQLFVERGRMTGASRALELGCGIGVFLEPVARCGARLRGLDLSADLLARARSRVGGLANVGLDRGNAEALPYREGAFDVVYGSSVLHHVDLQRTLREAHRVLKAGGRVVFAEPNILNPQVAVMFKVTALKGWFGVSPDEMAFTRFRARRILEEMGFAGVEVRPFDFLHPAVPAALVSAAAAAGSVFERVPLLREISGSLLLTAIKR